MCLGALLQYKSATGLYMPPPLFFFGEEDIVLERGREKHAFVIDFHHKLFLQRTTGTTVNRLCRYEIHEVISLSTFTSLQRKTIKSTGNY